MFFNVKNCRKAWLHMHDMRISHTGFRIAERMHAIALKSIACLPRLDRYSTSFLLLFSQCHIILPQVDYRGSVVGQIEREHS